MKSKEMKKRYGKLRPNVIQLIGLLSLFLILQGLKSWSQSTVKQDSICICGTKIEIDSALKMLNDYADLKTQSDLSEKAYSDSKELTAIERSQILAVLNLQGWDVKKVKARIRRHKFKKWIWAGAGIATGVIFGVFMR